MSYFDWLSMLLFPDGYERLDYSELLFALYDTEFYWTISRDKNRAEDGLLLRDEYENETGECVDIDCGCTLFEFFIGIGRRCSEELMYDSRKNQRDTFWATFFMGRIFLMEMTNDRFDRDQFDYIVNRFMGRKYSPNGDFCPFFCPIKNVDFRRLELIYQLNYYLKWRFSDEFE